MYGIYVEQNKHEKYGYVNVNLVSFNFLINNKIRKQTL